MNVLFAAVRRVVRDMRLVQLELCIRWNDHAVAMSRLALYRAIRTRDELMAEQVIHEYQDTYVPPYLLKPTAKVTPIKRKGSKA